MKKAEKRGLSVGFIKLEGSDCMKLNFGCGKVVLDGYINCDLNPVDDRVCSIDLNFLPLPFDDGSVDEIVCSHVLEHLDKPMSFVIDCYRILRKGGVFLVRLPCQANTLAHLRFNHTVGYFDKVCKGADMSFSSENEIMFDLVSVKGHLWFRSMLIRISHFIKSFIFYEYEYRLRKI